PRPHRRRGEVVATVGGERHYRATPEPLARHTDRPAERDGAALAEDDLLRGVPGRQHTPQLVPGVGATERDPPTGAERPGREGRADRRLPAPPRTLSTPGSIPAPCRTQDPACQRSGVPLRP